MKRVLGWVFMVIIANILLYTVRYVYKKALDTDEIIAYTNVRDEIRESKQGKQNPSISQKTFIRLSKISDKSIHKVYWFNVTHGEFCGRIEEDGKNMITVLCDYKDCARIIVRKSKNNYFLYNYQFFEYNPKDECNPLLVDQQ